MAIKINLKKAARTVLEDGNYALQIAKCEQGESKSGQPKLHLEYVPDEAQHPDLVGARIFEDISLQEQTWFRVLALLEGVYGDIEGDDEGDYAFDPEDLEGALVGATVEVDDSYDGTPRNRIKRVFNMEFFDSMAGDDDMGGEED